MPLPESMRSLAHFTRRLASMYSEKATPPDKPWTPRQRYRLLDAYYVSNGVYLELAESLRLAGVHMHAIAEIRNPTHAAVEFYPTKLWPGPIETALQIRPDDPAASNSDALTTAIRRVWEWSNWGAKKQLAARNLALHGDLFLQACSRAKKVGEADGKPVYEATGSFIKVVDAKEVSDFRTDERGFVTYLRHDVSNVDSRNVTYFTATAWSKERGDMRRWTHTLEIDAPIERLGEPDETVPLSAMGIDFVPFVHCPFRDVGPEDGVPRGLPLIWPALTKIDNVNRNATRLNWLLFRHGKPTHALRSNMVDSMGRPISVNLDLPADSDGEKQWGDDDVLKLPGNAELQQLIAPINYTAHAQQVADDIRAIEMDLPELAYQRIMEKGEMSGIALQRVFDVVVSRVIEVRGNAYPALRRATQMALSIAQAGGVDGFEEKTLGTFDAGAFGFSLTGQDVIPQTDSERGATAQVYVAMGVPVDMALTRYAGWNDEDAAKVALSRSEADARAAVAMTAPAAPKPAYKNDDPVKRAVTRRADTDALTKAVEDKLADAAVKTKSDRPTPPDEAVQRAMDALKKRL